MTDLRDLIRSYDDAVAPALCDRIVALFEAAPHCHRGPRGRPVERRDAQNFNWVQMNTSDLASFAAIDVEFAQRVNHCLGRYVADTGYAVVPYAFEEFLIKRYRASLDEQFPPHVDISNRGSMHRMLAVLLYLNDVAEGGETSFVKLGVNIQPRRGRLLMFPPTWMYPHAGQAPRAGIKYILGTYLIYVDPPKS